MGITDGIKGMLAGQKDTVDGVVDQAVDAGADLVKEKTPDQLDGVVDQGGGMAKDAIKDQLD